MTKNTYFLVLLTILLTSCQNNVDLIVHNATVYALGEPKKIVTAFVVNEGKFIAVGGEELVNDYKAKRVLDLKKLPVYPGFIDSHCHFLKLGLSLQQVDLRGTRSFKEVINRSIKKVPSLRDITIANLFFEKHCFPNGF